MSGLEPVTFRLTWTRSARFNQLTHELARDVKTLTKFTPRILILGSSTKIELTARVFKIQTFNFWEILWFLVKLWGDFLNVSKQLFVHLFWPKVGYRVSRSLNKIGPVAFFARLLGLHNNDNININILFLNQLSGDLNTAIPWQLNVIFFKITTLSL